MNPNDQIKQESFVSLFPQMSSYTSYASSPASEWSTCSDFSFSDTSSYNSPMSSPKFTQMSATPEPSYFAPKPLDMTFGGAPLYPSVNLPSSSLDFDAQSAPLEPEKPKHIPRPANAFMLFRSDFLRRRVIPEHVERRQQNLSRVAGECWQLLPDAEKAVWRARAAQELARHKLLYPAYKFTPAPRGAGRARAKGRAEAGVVDEKQRIRELREKYARVAGPAVAPAQRKRRRARQQGHVAGAAGYEAGFAAGASAVQQEPLAYAGYAQGSASFAGLFAPPADVRFQRRPSTSLGFATYQNEHGAHSLHMSLDLARPASAASTAGLSRYTHDMDITPTAANFGNIPPPPPYEAEPSERLPATYSTPQVDAVLGLRSLQLPFCALDASGTQAVPMPANAQDAVSPHDAELDRLMDTYYPNPTYAMETQTQTPPEESKAESDSEWSASSGDWDFGMFMDPASRGALGWNAAPEAEKKAAAEL